MMEESSVCLLHLKRIYLLGSLGGYNDSLFKERYCFEFFCRFSVGKIFSFQFLITAMKKRGGGSVSPPLPDPRNVNHMANAIVLPTKNGTKKSKLNVVSSRFKL